MDTLDDLLNQFADGLFTVSLKLVVKILEGVDSETDDWNAKAFIGFMNSLLASDSDAKGILIVRRDRDIGKGTGTLLSPTDRELGDDYPEQTGALRPVCSASLPSPRIARSACPLH